ncbi:MAG: Eco57I restriction-modification methylase domain-containing protein [Betaproteobacteria bacterium]|nr:Eco57I restriction-modification methylase domain-containing protein [Betaproteobacteria bacterium]
MKESNDILVLFESLNNHEVFTPPRLARQMLDLFPDDVWVNPEHKFLDPCVKSGVFLREIFYKLFDGLKGKGKFTADDGITYNLNDNHQRINHIFKNMLYGIATSELTGYVSRRTLYGVMEADSDKQISSVESFERSKNFTDWTDQQRLDFIGRNQFNDYYDHTIFKTKEYEGFEKEGNIFYPSQEVNEIAINENNFIIEETYFPFIDSRTKHKKIIAIKDNQMKFDVIVGNPPYQQNDGGHGASASPIYNLFIDQAKLLSPRYILMIIPSRWFAGGKGLDDFRSKMLSDNKLRYLYDYVNAKECFPRISIGGGVCYFLWDNTYNGKCEVVNIHNGEKQFSVRDLNEFPIFVRYNRAIDIIKKVLKLKESVVSEIVSSRNPFGQSSSERGKETKDPDSVSIYSSKGVGFLPPSKIKNGLDLVNKYKVSISKVTSEHAGEPDKSGKFKILSNIRVLSPNEICTDSYLVIGNYDKETMAENLANYLKTKFARFLLLQAVSSINLSKDKFCFIPLQDFLLEWTDEKLFKKYSLTKEEVSFIDSLIKPMD